MKARVLGTVVGIVVVAAAAAAFLGGRRPPAGASDGPTPLEDLTRAQLYERARQAGVAGRSAMSKAQLLAALRRP